MNDLYTPTKIILERYADVLVNFALNSGAGIKKGEVVEISIPDIAKPLAKELQIAVLKSGGHPIIKLIPTGDFIKDFFEFASDEQLIHFPKKYFKAKSNLLDHAISIIAETDPLELINIDSKKIMKTQLARYPYREWQFEKERNNKFTWTVGLYGTQAKADNVGLTLKEYWEQIINACFLDKKDPVEEWRQLSQVQKDINTKLNKLEIETLHIVGPDADLTVKLGVNRAWRTGGGANIPSFEHFTSPDWRGTNGWIKFNQPLYRYGNIIEGVELEFKNGLVTKAIAKKGEKVLRDMIETKDANKIGEFSLTDKRLSRITHSMAETLFDENIGGPFGNTHIAVGMAYKECYKGDASKVKNSEWKKMGYNNSSVHTDIVSTVDRTVTATLTNGEKLLIYENGQFVL
ncbi:MAG: aminopeptidase [Candidatus Pacebacteria bacterium CG_4_10_14_3_um_filter_34_15]|nr:aminopeptidase [Candidatus Pacearchaeota archaeon]NCQ65756.1 aminopeptidase [Candidatus Paceibacterota bacterium]OIO44155.1 MAG: thermophilic metalloprotease (M29) superfamily [Candidatus Pacebacteria bacterium CG1_02_43_31]PIQ81113.1 MAG: thermophilic metalloprotease (M29) superfamily [Candidatus Pacebacteria bacterium CG11_big_fil_rev_8_21_14_0_20_34_55]PIX81043.1 MAG: aminopeptidase [Candidatus Pacebacteria bacterium CG_4_10_14_3_um_filter_34_15]PJC44132.1 MAG: aminopeptidase [Candidatus